MSCYIGCTRFTNETMNENRVYTKDKKIDGCIYGVPRRIPSKIPVKSSVIVFEMNNDENKLIGAGLIKNWIDTSKRRSIYKDGNFNRYIYRGKFTITRDEMIEHGEKEINFLEKILFTGRTNFKRGDAITCMSEKYQEIFSRTFEKSMKKHFATMFQEKYQIK